MKLTYQQYVRAKKAVAYAFEDLVWLPDHRKSTHYVSPKLVVKLTRRSKHDKRARQEVFVLTVGAPNFAERAHLKADKKMVFRWAVAPWPKKRGEHSKTLRIK